jgi:pyroglutamyl-peptidase
MATVLITAFEPYDEWQDNSSWLTLIELTKNLPDVPHITTRRYPVDFQQLRARLAKDLEDNYDFAIHLGQAPGCARIRFEAIGVNVAGPRDAKPEEYRPLVEDGPTAYRTALPLRIWTERLRRAGIPCEVSYHAGTFLCNAALYLSHYLAERQGRTTRSVFVHLPLDVTQTIDRTEEYPAVPRTTLATAIRLILDELEEQSQV